MLDQDKTRTCFDASEDERILIAAATKIFNAFHKTSKKTRSDFGGNG